MSTVSKSVGKLTGKTLSGLKKATEKTIQVTKEAPAKTSSKLTNAKTNFVEGFRSEVPAKETQKIGDVETLTPDNITHYNNQLEQ